MHSSVLIDCIVDNIPTEALCCCALCPIWSHCWMNFRVEWEVRGGCNPSWYFSRLSVFFPALPIFHACLEIDVQRGEHEARKPVVLMFSPWSFDLASRQLSLISVFVDDYWGKWVVRHRSYLSLSHSHFFPRTHSDPLLMLCSGTPVWWVANAD